MRTPLEQFIIKPIVRINTTWYDLTITNSTIYLIITIIGTLGLLNITINNNKILKNKWSYIISKLYLKIEEIVKETIPVGGGGYIPMIIGIFIFILGNNVIGLIPYSFTTTAHIIITVTMSITIMIGVTIIGIQKHKWKFIKLFIPQGLNEGRIKVIIPLIFFFEVISYLIRVISLSVRLTANLMSGHTLLKILANFGLKITILLPYLFIVPILLLSAIYILEIAVAMIQAYVFALLTITYIRDTSSLH